MKKYTTETSVRQGLLAGRHFFVFVVDEGVNHNDPIQTIIDHLKKIYFQTWKMIMSLSRWFGQTNLKDFSCRSRNRWISNIGESRCKFVLYNFKQCKECLCEGLNSMLNKNGKSRKKPSVGIPIINLSPKTRKLHEEYEKIINKSQRRKFDV
jgi:hypothetical protein